MSTQHRGLPPPSAMALPDPLRPSQAPQPSLPSASYPQALGPMPPQPSQWQGQEESMRQWLAAKTEEDRRKQEEEKTRQEGLRLEQRRIEHSMLRESLQAGVPPHLVPLIYGGIGGANLAQLSLDWLHQYVVQLQAAQQQQQQQIAQAAPEYPRDPRMIGQTAGPFQPGYGVPPPLPGPPGDSHNQHPVAVQATFNAYQPPARPGPTPVPRSATHTQLPRLTTNEMYQQPATNQASGAHPQVQQIQTASDRPGSSPSIYFHHWVPPNESKDNKPNPGSSNVDPSSAPSVQDSSEYRDSPRKRKAQGGHEPNPPPSSSNSMKPSPSFSNTSSGSARRGLAHQRSQSNISMREPESGSRPESRRDPEPPPRSSAPITAASATADLIRERREEPVAVQEVDSRPVSEPPKS